MIEDKETNRQCTLDEEIHGTNSDWFLKRLVSLINKNVFDIGITLSINGGVITGQLISGSKYFEIFSDSMSQAWPGGDKDNVIKNAFASHSKIYEVTEEETEDDKRPRIIQYLHLKDARYIQGNSFINVGLWRGKINSVSGFSLGTFSNS